MSYSVKITPGHLEDIIKKDPETFMEAFNEVNKKYTDLCRMKFWRCIENSALLRT